MFNFARFEQARHFGPMLADRRLDLDQVQFAQPVQIEVSTTGLCCRRARFPGGVQFRLRWARVILDDADFPHRRSSWAFPAYLMNGWPPETG